MYSNEDINKFADLIVDVSKPDRIILFGSYAYGHPTDSSDVDFLVIKNGKEISFEEEAELSTAVYLKRKEYKIRTRYDVFFRTDNQVHCAAKNGGAFADALEKGRIIYDRRNKQEGRAVL